MNDYDDDEWFELMMEMFTMISGDVDDDQRVETESSASKVPTYDEEG